MSTHNSKSLLKSAADAIDALDEQINQISSQKADVFANIRETVSKVEYKAWRAAVKMRQRKLKDPAAFEEAEDALATMFFNIGGTEEFSAKHGPIANETP